MDVNLPDVLAEVEAAFARYERALMANDLPVLDELFWADGRTVRYGVGEVLHGVEEIRAFRSARPAQGLARVLERTVVTTFGRDFASRFAASRPFARNASTSRRSPPSRSRSASTRPSV